MEKIKKGKSKTNLKVVSTKSSEQDLEQYQSIMAELSTLLQVDPAVEPLDYTTEKAFVDEVKSSFASELVQEDEISDELAKFMNGNKIKFDHEKCGEVEEKEEPAGEKPEKVEKEKPEKKSTVKAEKKEKAEKKVQVKKGQEKPVVKAEKKDSVKKYTRINAFCTVIGEKKALTKDEINHAINKLYGGEPRDQTGNINYMITPLIEFGLIKIVGEGKDKTYCLK